MNTELNSKQEIPEKEKEWNKIFFPDRDKIISTFVFFFVFRRKRNFSSIIHSYSILLFSSYFSINYFTPVENYSMNFADVSRHTQNIGYFFNES